MTDDLMTEIAEIITDMRRIEYDLNDPMRHCKSELKRLAGNILADATSQARDGQRRLCRRVCERGRDC